MTGVLPTRSQWTTLSILSRPASGRAACVQLFAFSLFIAIPTIHVLRTHVPFIVHEGTRDGGFFPDKISSNSFGLFASFGSKSSRFFLFCTLSIVGTFRKARVERSASINLKQTNHEKVIFHPINRMNSRKRTYSAISEHWTIATMDPFLRPYEHSAEAAQPPCSPPRRTRPTPHRRPSD